MNESISREALATLVENHRRFLSFLERRIGIPEDAEEILQAAFVKGVERGGDIVDNEKTVAWFYRLLRNAVADYYRKRGAEQRVLDKENRLSLEPEEPEPSVEQALCQCIFDLLPTLKEEYATLLQRIDLQDESISEVAAETGMTPNNTRVKLHRARKALRKQLERSCGTCTEHGCLDCTCGKPNRIN